jgi:hypothetical protein
LPALVAGRAGPDGNGGARQTLVAARTRGGRRPSTIVIACSTVIVGHAVVTGPAVDAARPPSSPGRRSSRSGGRRHRPVGDHRGLVAAAIARPVVVVASRMPSSPPADVVAR